MTIEEYENKKAEIGERIDLLCQNLDITPEVRIEFFNELLSEIITTLNKSDENLEQESMSYTTNEENVLYDENSECIFSKKEFLRLYPELDDDSENDKKIKMIKEKLSGIPVYKEYTEEYIRKVKELFNRYPNFADYEHFFIPEEDLLKLKIDNNIKMDNILIYGDPACGKSSLVNQLCEIYQDYYRTSLGNGSVNFTLMGNDKGYNKSDCGDILRAMFRKNDGPIANPLVILDEIDKANYGSGRDTDLSGTFSVLLEKNNSKNFSDNFFKVEVDASHINYIAIANDITKLPAHVLSRFPIKLHIRNYTEEELKDVVFDNQYQTWIKNNSINPKQVPPSLPPIAKKLLLDCTGGYPRSVDAVLNKIASVTVRKFGFKYFATFQPSKEECENILHFFKNDENKTTTIGFAI